jgi:prolyl-tRNA synthetase
MKDSYSFDQDEAGLDRSYQLHLQAYQRIFSRCGLQFYVVQSDPGMMGGAESHEFMAPSEAGEDEVAFCPSCGYAANLELATSRVRLPDFQEMPLQEVATPEARTIEEVSAFLQVDPRLLIKSILVVTKDGPLLAMVRGDQQLLPSKLTRLVGEFRPADAPAEPQAVQREDGSWLLDGRLPLDELKELFGLTRLPQEEDGGYQTLGGLIMTHLGRIPKTADHFDWEGFRFEVVDMDGKRVDKVLVQRTG